MAPYDFFDALEDRARRKADRTANVDLGAAGCRGHVHLDAAVDAPQVDRNGSGDVGGPRPQILVENDPCGFDPPADLRWSRHLDRGQGVEFLEDRSHLLYGVMLPVASVASFGRSPDVAPDEPTLAEAHE